MRTIKLTNGAEIPLDGELLTIFETLYHELTKNIDEEISFEVTTREIQRIVEQMSDGERRDYLAESLFLNYVSYETQRMEQYMKRLAAKEAETSKQP